MSAAQSICVVGSGPVGLATALRLADRGLDVTVLDGGSPGIKSPGAEFNRGKVVSAASAPDVSDPTLLSDGTLYVSPEYLARTRRRGASGSGWQWGVAARNDSPQCIRLAAGSEQDFEARPSFDIPSWVTPAREVTSKYADALNFFGLDGHTFDLADYCDDRSPIELNDPRLSQKLFHFGQANMIREVRLAELHRHPQVRMLHGQHLTGFSTEAGGSRVTKLSVSDLDGNLTTVTADHFVFALGGIENSRQLLLAAQDGVIEDRHDVFGRWFMDHPHFRFGFLTPTGPASEFSWYDFQNVGGASILRGHELNSAEAAEADILRFSIDLVGRHPLDATKAGHGLATAFDGWRARSPRQLVQAGRTLARSPLTAARLANDLRSGPVYNTAVGGWSEPKTRYEIGTLGVEAMFEQRPSPDNRVRLGNNLDRFGRRLPDLQWSWSQTEIDSIQQAADLVEQSLSDTGVGTYTPLQDLGQGKIPRAGSGAHHLGGTRQSLSPEDGVVDGNNRVHGVDNLTMVGSSVFATSVGYANPTLTAIADGIRVADHLAGVSVAAVPTGNTRR